MLNEAEITAVGAREAPPARRRRGLTNDRAWPWITPGLLVMSLTTFVPAAATAAIAFTNLSIARRSDWSWVGVENFSRLFTGSNSQVFARVLAWNLVYAAATTGLALLVGLLLALLLNDDRIRERSFYRTVLIVPWALPSVITVVAWSALLNGSFGPVNQALSSFGLGPVDWLTNPTWARLTCIAVSVWIAFPFMMTACLGALQAIPRDLIEAARVDGGGAFAITRYVTVPLLSTSLRPLVIAAFAMQMNNFGVIFLLTNGGPTTDISSGIGSTDILVTYLYKVAFTGADQNYGLSSAVGLVLFLIVGTITLANAWALGALRTRGSE